VKLPTSTRIPLLIRGPASSADIADRLFQPFVTSKSHGMGVRLSICRTIIESDGSHIVAEVTLSGSTILKTAFAELSEET
jgi:C4-dicarboxylate-specific signal transduction histidine kinase